MGREQHERQVARAKAYQAQLAAAKAPPAAAAPKRPPPPPLRAGGASAPRSPVMQVPP